MNFQLLFLGLGLVVGGIFWITYLDEYAMLGLIPMGVGVILFISVCLYDKILSVDEKDSQSDKGKEMS